MIKQQYSEPISEAVLKTIEIASDTRDMVKSMYDILYTLDSYYTDADLNSVSEYLKQAYNALSKAESEIE
jgi:hypothetical protein